MPINSLVSDFLKENGADIIEFVDIDSLPARVTRNYGHAVLIGISLSREYIRRISKESKIDHSEFTQKENGVDRLAEKVADIMMAHGYQAYAQSESNIEESGLFDHERLVSILPHKTIALLAGIGWIGKDDLLVTKDYGSALCMCTVLTNAPVISERKDVMTSCCGPCNLCQRICPGQAIRGKTWELGCEREHLVDVSLCACCLQCLSHCIWTQRYANRQN
jgi:epoxyqueuosine reductase